MSRDLLLLLLLLRMSFFLVTEEEEDEEGTTESSEDINMPVGSGVGELAGKKKKGNYTSIKVDQTEGYRKWQTYGIKIP